MRETVGGKIFTAIPKIMAAVDPIAKNRQADKYKFRGIDDAYQALQKIMADCGVFSVPYVEAMERRQGSYKSGSTFEHVILTVRYTFYADDGSSVEARVIGEGMDSGDKAANKAMSVADKYALLQVFKIPTAEAKDPEYDEHDVAPRSALKTAPAGGATPPTRSGPPQPGAATHKVSPQARELLDTLKTQIGEVTKPQAPSEAEVAPPEVFPFEVTASTIVPFGQFKSKTFGEKSRTEWQVYLKHLQAKMAEPEITPAVAANGKKLIAMVEAYLLNKPASQLG